VDVPDERALATPADVIVPTAGFDEVHGICPLSVKLEPSLNDPDAMNCWDPPTGIEAVPGVMLIDVRVAFVTVSDAVPTCPANAAEMVVVPGCTPVARPAVDCTLLMVAIPELDDVQVAKPVRSCWSPLLKVPIALNRSWKPAATFVVCGVTCTEVRVADSTSRFAVALTEPVFAVMVVIPADSPVANPVRFRIATVLSDEVQVSNAFMPCVVPSVNVPVAVNCSPDAGAISAVVGFKLSDASVAELTVNESVPVAVAPA
jgi:hypothetical protein